MHNYILDSTIKTNLIGICNSNHKNKVNLNEQRMKLTLTKKIYDKISKCYIPMKSISIKLSLDLRISFVGVHKKISNMLKERKLQTKMQDKKIS